MPIIHPALPIKLVATVFVLTGWQASTIRRSSDAFIDEAPLNGSVRTKPARNRPSLHGCRIHMKIERFECVEYDR